MGVSKEQKVGQMASIEKSSLRKGFERARDVHPVGITGRESPGEIITRMFPAYVGRQERTAFELMRRSSEDDTCTLLTMSGTMTPAGLHQSCVIPLVERGLVDCVATTGANLYYDAHRVLGHRIREIDPGEGDPAYRLARIVRIYDLGLREEALLETDKLFSALMFAPDYQRRMTTTELHWLLGRDFARIEDELGIRSPSLLSTCYRYGVPIFVGAVQDGAIFLNIVKMKRLFGSDFALEVDVHDDAFEMGAMQHHCAVTLGKKMAIWALGGGVPRSYALQGSSLLGQILGVPTRGVDFDVQLCVDPKDSGTSSGEFFAREDRSSERAQSGAVYVHCDVTAVFPWLTYALLSDPRVHRKARRLFDARVSAARQLQREIDKRKRKLLDTVRFALPRRAPNSKKRSRVTSR